MVYQDPMTSLNPLLQGADPDRRDPARPRRRPGRRGGPLPRRCLAQVGLPDPDRVEHAFPHELSGGMLQRVMIAMALAVSPRLLIADEPTTALDVTIQQQILELVEDMQPRTGMAVVWVTHDLGVVARIVDKVVVMYAGRVVEQAPTRRFFARPAIRTRWPCWVPCPHRAPATGNRSPRSAGRRRTRRLEPAARSGPGAPSRSTAAPRRSPPCSTGGGVVAACWRSPDEWQR